MSKPLPQRFSIEFDGGSVLSVEDIWPDGDAPENPTTQDVAVRIAESGWPERFLTEWNMAELLRVWVIPTAGGSAKSVEVKFR